MTKRNEFGISAEVAYDFEGWVWEDKYPGLVAQISRAAADAVLKEMARDSHIWIDSNDAGKCIIEFSCFDSHVSFAVPLAKAIDQWIISRGNGGYIHPDDAKELMAELELALRKIKARIKPP